jgi:hypothetical protein
VDRLLGSVSMSELFAEPPDITFPTEEDVCPLCGGRLKVRKTVVRTVATMDVGTFRAHETVMACDRCEEAPPVRSEQLAELVPPGCRFGCDVMTFVGRAVFDRLHPAADVVAELRDRRIGISESQVRELAARFIVSLGIAHAECAPRLREHLGLNGGYILHLDSTCQKGSSHLMTGIDELSGLVLLSAAMPTENSTDTAAFLRSLVSRYGLPAAVSCDRSSGILRAVESELRGVPVFICHFHFLRDIGTSLIEPDYRTIREGLRKHGPMAGLRRLQRELGESLDRHGRELETLLSYVEQGEPIPRQITDAVPPEAALAALIASVIEAPHQGDGCGFPFDRPHLHTLRQIQLVNRSLQSLLRFAHYNRSVRQCVQRTADLLAPVCSDAELLAAADRIELKASVFDRLRTAMRIAEPDSGSGLNDQGSDADIHTIRRSVTAFRHQVQDDPTLMAEPAFVRMLQQLDECWSRLFCDPLVLQTPAGPVTVQPHRTNNVLERFFRRLNRDHRKRTGHQLTAHALDRMLPDLPLIRNLDSDLYCAILLDGCHTLAHRLSKVDRTLVTDSLEAARRNRARLPRPVRRTLRRRTTPLQIAIGILTNTA